jgi:hypothetical protein
MSFSSVIVSGALFFAARCFVIDGIESHPLWTTPG